MLLSVGVEDAAAQERLVIPRIAGPVVVDGHIDEALWGGIEPLPMGMHLPNFGEDPSRPTEIRIAHDDDALYVAARCYTDPRDIVGTSLRRNIWTTGTDYVAIVLDTFNDNETALGFGVTPTGARVDYAVANDAGGSTPVNINWDGFWEAAVAHFEDGWSAEMRIPFANLRFRDRGEDVTMGLIAWRWMAASAEMNTFPAIPPRWGWWSWTKPSQAHEVVFRGIRNRRPVYITPYVLGGFGQEFRLDQGAAAYVRHDDPAHEIGADVKFGVTSDLTLDLTLNTDFAQVEADDQEVNLTRFSLFFPERRVFFQERASLYDFGPPETSSYLHAGAPSTHHLFYSRRIGLHQGQPVRILGGARLTGRMAGWDVGLLNMQTGRERDLLDFEGVLPSENFGVARLRRPVLNPYSYAGGMITSRVRADGAYNVAFGVDGTLRLFGDDYLSIAGAHSLDDQHAGGVLAASRLHAVWERRALDGFGYRVSASRSGAHYEPGTGFALRNDYTRIGDRFFYGWQPGEASAIQHHQLFLNAVGYVRNEDGSIETVEIGPSWEGRMKSDAIFQARAFLLHENLRDGFLLAEGVDVPAGTYTFPTFAGMFQFPSTRAVRGQVRLTAGAFFDGYRISPSIAPSWVVSRHLFLSAFYGIDFVRFPDRDQEILAHVARFRVETMLDTRLSAVTFVQYNSAIDAVVANFRLRFNRGDGRDLYIVVNEQLNTRRNHVSPTLPPTAQRAVLAKYTHTLTW